MDSVPQHLWTSDLNILRNFNHASNSKNVFFRPIKSMLESNLDKLNVNFWNQMKSLTESHCARYANEFKQPTSFIAIIYFFSYSLNDPDLELSAHVIRLIVVDTQHRMQQKIVQDKMYTLFLYPKSLMIIDELMCVIFFYDLQTRFRMRPSNRWTRNWTSDETLWW